MSLTSYRAAPPRVKGVIGDRAPMEWTAVGPGAVVVNKVPHAHA